MKKNLYVITLEPIEQRYTKQWYKYWKNGFSKWFNVIYIDGNKFDDKIKKGRFLDINRTNMWKAKQVYDFAQLFDVDKIKDSDRFIFMDAWHFGVTALKYMLQLNNIKAKIFGYWHAGTYDKEDFTYQGGLSYWARNNELGWMKALDGNFVATKFHQKLIFQSFKGCVLLKNIHVVGFPMDWKAQINNELHNVFNSKIVKKDLIVFPHRLDKEKKPEEFDNLKRYFPNVVFIKTLEVTNTKKEYYELLKHAKIVFSASTQETFGIGTVEALMLGAVPVVPIGLSYDELYLRQFRYTSQLEAVQKIRYILKNYDKSKILQKNLNRNINKIQEKSLGSIAKMAEVMIK